MSVACHPGNLSPIFSIQGSKSAYLNFLSENGRPKYVQGNWAGVQGIYVLMLSTAGCSHLMGIAQLFWRLVWRPEACPNLLSISIVKLISTSAGLIKSATSSAYNKMVWLALCRASGCSNPISPALVNKLFKTSITKIKSMGERGFPCLSPRWCHNSSPGWPFTKIYVDAMRSRLEMRFRHILDQNPSVQEPPSEMPKIPSRMLLIYRALRIDSVPFVYGAAWWFAVLECSCHECSDHGRALIRHQRNQKKGPTG